MNSVRRVRRKVNKLKRFSRLGNKDQVMTFEAAVLLGVARIALLVVPFRKVAEKLGTPHSAAAPHNVLKPAREDEEELARRVSESVQRAAKNVPFRAVCIHQALVAKLMLEQRGVPSVMHFGVARNGADADDALRAHAWLNTATVEITGFPVEDDLKEIAYFI
jgi:hypothetical protein